MMALQDLKMLKGIYFVIILYLLTSTQLKSSADGPCMENLYQFSKAIYPDFLQCISFLFAENWCCLDCCQHGNTITSQNLLMARWCFFLSIWKAETPRVHKVCVKDKFLLMSIFMSCVEGGVACCVLTTVQIIGITGIPLQKNTFPLHKKLLFCISHFPTASISQEAYLHDRFVEWVQKKPSKNETNVLLIHSSIILLLLINPEVKGKDSFVSTYV